MPTGHKQSSKELVHQLPNANLTFFELLCYNAPAETLKSPNSIGSLGQPTQRLDGP